MNFSPFASSRIKLGLLAVSLLLASTFGAYRLCQQLPNRWATLLVGHDGLGGSLKRQLLYGLQAAQAGGNVHIGALLPLAHFVTAQGTTTTIILVEGEILKSEIAPASTWRHLGKHHLLLVNSVDQDQKISKGISVGIGAGCGLQQPGLIPLNLGDVALRRCTGLYHEKYNVDWVANLAIIIDRNVDSQEKPCVDTSTADPDLRYQQCVAEAVGLALRNFFKELRSPDAINPDGVVFPALGTGVGRLPKNVFYKLFFSQLYKELDTSDSLPQAIYLQVWAGDRTPWSQTKNAIATWLADTAADWNETNHKQDTSDWAALVGVTAGLALILFGASVGKPLLILGKDVATLAAGPPLTLLIGWFAASLGMVTVFKPLLALLSSRFGPWPQILVGMITTIGCGHLLRANHQFDSTMRPLRDLPTDFISNRRSSREKEFRLTE